MLYAVGMDETRMIEAAASPALCKQDPSTTRGSSYSPGRIAARQARWSKEAAEDDEEDERDLEPLVDSNIPYMRAGPKIGRNDPCPCGSGKKYKRCCLPKAEAKASS